MSAHNMNVVEESIELGTSQSPQILPWSTSGQSCSLHCPLDGEWLVMRIKTKLLLIDICSKSITCTKDQDVDINSNLWIKCYLGHDTRRSHRWYSCNRRNDYIFNKIVNQIALLVKLQEMYSQIDSPTHSRETFESVGESDCNRGSRDTLAVSSCQSPS